MSYTITARIYQCDTNTSFRVVEKTVWKYANGGTWSEVDGAHVLTMGGSGTCGSLRLVSDTSESCIVTLGVHNYRRWGDIVTNLSSDQTGVVIMPEYYSDEHPDKERQRWKQLTAYNVNSAGGHSFAFKYTVADGNHLEVDVVIR
jgi:hypothetical protein